MRVVPSVISAGTMGWTPVVGGGGTWSIGIEVRRSRNRQVAERHPDQVTPGFFSTLGIRIVRGRAFTEQDREDAPPVAIINEAMGKWLWLGDHPSATPSDVWRARPRG